MRNNYPTEKYGSAIRLLALGPGELQERLAEATWEAGMANTGWDNQELRRRHEELHSALNGKNGPKGSIKETVLPMEYDTAREHAEEMLSIYEELEREWFASAKK